MEQVLEESKQSLSNSKKEFPILAIDYGARRIGLAISDMRGGVAAPLKALIVGKRQKPHDMIPFIKELVVENRVKSILLGYPEAFAEGHKKQQTVIDQFKELLHEQIEIEIKLFDESFSSVEASQKLDSQELNWSQKKKRIDSASAALFLQIYLDKLYD